MIENESDCDQLTPQEISDGWHYCYTWGGLLIGPGDKKMDLCKCKINKNIHEQIKNANFCNRR